MSTMLSNVYSSNYVRHLHIFTQRENATVLNVVTDSRRRYVTELTVRLTWLFTKT